MVDRYNVDDTNRAKEGWMNLTQEQIDAYKRDGFLVLPELFSPSEVNILRAETERLRHVEADGIFREGEDDKAKTMFRMHEPDGPTYSSAYRALSRTPRSLGVAQQVLDDTLLYMHHCKVNMKPSIEGTVWHWHQDFGSWHLDGIAKPTMATMMVMLDEATELGGCLYMLPGSHTDGRFTPYYDESTAYKFWATPAAQVKARMAGAPDPVAIIGKPGTVAIFDCNTLHASGHNLSARDRWQIYLCYNLCANRPGDIEKPRPDYVRSRNWAPMDLLEDDAILAGERLAAE
jgi:ectoine hydroxylase